MSQYIVSTFYKFVKLDALDDLKASLLDFCNNNQIKGTILIAEEGVNSTLTADRANIDKFYDFIKSMPAFSDLEFKESKSDYPPFKKMKVKIKPEIVKLAKNDLIDIDDRGEYLDAEEWNKLVKNSKTILLDTRNDYEVAFGTFENAVNPSIRNFTDLPDWVEENLEGVSKDTPVAMFCTGGIRCEKSTAYMKAKGYKNVYHLRGGILKYFEETKESGTENLWNGRCFVFDDRIAVDKDLSAIYQPASTNIDK